MVLPSSPQTAILRCFGESASASPSESSIECQAEAPRKACVSPASCRDFPVVIPSSLILIPVEEGLPVPCPPGTAVQPPALQVISQTGVGERSQTELSLCEFHWILLYHQGLSAPTGFCKMRTSSGVFFEGQQRESIFAIPGSRPGLPTHLRYVTFWGGNVSSCRKPSCLAKAQDHIRTSQGPSVRAAGQPSTAFCEHGRSLGDKPLLH